MTVLAELEGRTSPGAALVVAVLAVSTSAILVRWSEAPSAVKALYRVLFTLALLAPLAVRDREEFTNLSVRDLGLAAAAGVALAGHFAVWFESLRFTSVAASVTLVQSQPLFVALGAALVLGERLTRLRVGGIAVALTGMAAMSADDLLTGTAGSAPLFGQTLALTGAVLAAGYLLVGRSVRQHVPLIPYVCVVYAACVATLLMAAIVRGLPLGGYPAREWVLFVAMAVGPGLFGHTVLNWALARVDSSVVSVSLLGEPVGATVLALALLGEVPDAWTVGGGAVVLCGIYLTARDGA